METPQEALVRYIKTSLVNYLYEWEAAQRTPENPMSAAELFAGVSGKGGGMSGKDTRRNGRTQVLVEDMGPDSEAMHRALKGLREQKGPGVSGALVYWAINGFDIDIAHTKFVKDKGPTKHRDFLDDWRSAFAYLEGYFGRG